MYWAPFRDIFIKITHHTCHRIFKYIWTFLSFYVSCDKPFTLYTIPFEIFYTRYLTTYAIGLCPSPSCWSLFLAPLKKPLICPCLYTEEDKFHIHLSKHWCCTFLTVGKSHACKNIGGIHDIIHAVPTLSDSTASAICAVCSLTDSSTLTQIVFPAGDKAFPSSCILHTHIALQTVLYSKDNENHLRSLK
jgi:hypothetical protein